MRELGVGLVYWSDLAPLFEDVELVGVLELEPQTLWEKVVGPHGLCYRGNDALLQRVAQLPQAKLLHGVAQPVGGSADDPLEYIALWKRAVEVLDPAWVSEHLSFNRVRRGAHIEEAGFLLPPRQSPAGVANAVRNIERLSQALERPLAFETGVNYLQRRADELDDGTFFGAVAERAHCGILLDLHNLWCNERNGRQRVSEVLARLPLDQVWEIHLAGGMELDGFWLDAHSGLVPPEVVDLAAGIIPLLPNLGALIFEILPEHLPRIGVDAVHRQLDVLHALWRLRSSRRVVARDARAPQGLESCGLGNAEQHDDVEAWETALGEALRGRTVRDARFADLRDDPGVAVLHQLIGDARRSSLARVLRYTTTLLLIHLGPNEVRALLDAYFREQAPDPFTALEADYFARFLRSRAELVEHLPYLAETLAFEDALVRATVYGTATDLAWSTDPTALFAELENGRAPVGLPSVHSAMRVCAE